MQLIRKLALGVATLSVALGAGHLVQSGTEPRLDRVTVASPGIASTGPGSAGVAPSRQPAVAPAPANPSARQNDDTSAQRPRSIVTLSASLNTHASGPVKQMGTHLAALAAFVSRVAYIPKESNASPPVGTNPISVGLTSDQAATEGGPDPMFATLEAGKLPPASADAVPAPVHADLCAPDLSVWPQTGAMLAVALILPCAANAPLVLRHGGLALSARTGPDGVLRLSIPAMDPAGRVAVTLSDGAVLVRDTPLSLAGVRRVAVQWLDTDAMHLQVFENGAAFGAPGHLSATQPAGEGELIALGHTDADLPMMAEVYTWPVAPIPVEVSVEAEVTAATCGREILGQLLDSRDGTVTSTDLTLAMPGCDTTGDYLVLNNLVGDTTLAQAE